MYARVTGTLKQFGTKRYLNVAHIQPATDPHELLYHTFEAIYVTLAFSRGAVSLLLELVHTATEVLLSLVVVVATVNPCRG